MIRILFTCILLGFVCFTPAHGETVAPPQFIIETVAGTGEPGFSGDGGPATAAQLDHPTAVAADAAGNVYIADFGNDRIRRVSPDGVIETIAGSGERSPERADRVAAVELNIAQPYGIGLDGEDRVYVLIRGHHTIYRVEPDGMAARISGNFRAGYAGDGGPAVDAQLRGPNDLYAGPDGTLYVADSGNHRIRAIGTDGVIRHFAGDGEGGFSGDGGPATEARFAGLSALSADSAGNVYVADFNNHRIRKIDTSGIITTIAGTGNLVFNGDGKPALESNFGEPTGVATDTEGNLYIADQINNRIRAVTPDGIMHTVAGTGVRALDGDGGPATEAAIFIPDILCVAPNGDILFPDHQNNAVRRLVRQESSAP